MKYCSLDSDLLADILVEQVHVSATGRDDGGGIRRVHELEARLLLVVKRYCDLKNNITYDQVTP